jgi:DNA-binding protein H-NS
MTTGTTNITLEELVELLNVERNKRLDAVDEIHSMIQELKDDFNQKLTDVNEKLTDVNEKLTIERNERLRAERAAKDELNEEHKARIKAERRLAKLITNLQNWGTALTLAGLVAERVVVDSDLSVPDSESSESEEQDDSEEVEGAVDDPRDYEWRLRLPLLLGIGRR